MSATLPIAKILGGVAIAGWGLAGIVMWRADVISGQKDAAVEARIVCEQRHAITRQSVDTLQAEAERERQEALARAETYENSLRIARERANENERRATASNAMIARLEALAGQDGVCQVPEELLAEIEGL